MKIKKLTVTINGPLWRIRDFEIEGISVIDKWQEDTDQSKGTVTVTDWAVSEDDTLDVLIAIGAPNGSTYSVTLSGITDEIPARKIDYGEDNFKVVKSGRLTIIISRKIMDIIS